MRRAVQLLLHPLSLIVLTALACHALLPFTDYRAGEDNYLINWVTRQRFDYLMRIYSETGRTFTGWFFWSFHGLPALSTTFKLIGLVISAVSGMLLYTIALQTRFGSRAEALFLAIVTVAFPADKLLGGFMYSKPEICLCVFFLAGWLMLHAEQQTGLLHWLLRFLALILFYFAFLTESLLVYFGGFFLLLVLLKQRELGLPWYRIPWSYCFRRLDLVFLPFVCWLVRVTFTPSHGPWYTDVNKPEFRLEYLARYESLIGVFSDPLLLFWAFPLGIKVGLAALTLLTTLVILAARHTWEEEPTQKSPQEGQSVSRAVGLLVFGLILLILGTIPYVALNKDFAPTGQECRYAALTPLPLGLILLSIGTLLRPLGRQLSHSIALAVAGCLVVWIATWWHNDLSLQAVQIRNDAIFRQVHGHPQARDWSVYFVQNLFRIPRTIDDLNNWQWVFQEAGVSGEPRSIAFIPPNLRPHSEKEVRDFLWVSTIPYAMTSIDPAGKQGLIIVRRGKGLRTCRLALHYLYLKNFIPNRIGPFLDSVVQVDFFPAPWDPALVAQSMGE